VQLTDKNFKSLVLDSPSVWMVEFYAPWCGHCKNLAPAFEAAAANLKGIAKLGAINCDEEKNVCGQFKIEGFPTLKVFGEHAKDAKGNLVKQPKPYNGGRTAAAIANFMAEQIPNVVQTVTDSSLEKFLASPQQKFLLFTDKSKPSNLVKAVALEYKDSLQFGIVTKQQKKIAEKYEVTEFPAALVINKEGKVEKLEGKIARESLYQFAGKFATAKPKEDSSSQSNKKPATPPPVVKAEVVHVTSDELLQEKCYNHALCVIAILNEEEDSEVHRTYTEQLLQVAEKFKTSFRFVWVDGVKHPHLMEELNAGSDLPQVVAVNSKRLASANFLGAFGVDSITSWLERILRGTARVYEIRKLPTLNFDKK